MLSLDRADMQTSRYRISMVEQAGLVFNSGNVLRCVTSTWNKVFNILCHAIFRRYRTGEQQDVFLIDIKPGRQGITTILTFYNMILKTPF